MTSGIEEMNCPQDAEPRRCAECTCEGGEMECNWINPAPAPAVPVDGDAYYYAVRLASSMWEKHYPEAKDWSPLDTTLGVLTQIDNMVTGLCRAQPAPQVKALEWHSISRPFEDGQWVILYPGYYGPFTACWVNGAWTMCDESDLDHAKNAMLFDMASALSALSGEEQ